MGSAFTGNLVGTDREAVNNKTGAETEQFSDKLLSLARKMRMNTDIRRQIFCILMSAMHSKGEIEFRYPNSQTYSVKFRTNEE